jgi:hypothetical protein
MAKMSSPPFLLNSVGRSEVSQGLFDLYYTPGDGIDHPAGATFAVGAFSTGCKDGCRGQDIEAEAAELAG